MSEVKFCLNCGGLFDQSWNRSFVASYKDSKFCCPACERRHKTKEAKRSQQEVGKYKHGVMS